jgi:hypothetical protein
MACASAHSCWHGQLDAIATVTRRTLMRTSAPTLSSRSRMEPQVAVANWVCASRERCPSGTAGTARRVGPARGEPWRCPTWLSGKRPSRDIQLLGKPLNQRLDRLFQLGECHAGVTEKGKLNGEANSVGIPAAVRHQVLVGSGQGEAPHQAVRIERDVKSLPTVTPWVERASR